MSGPDGRISKLWDSQKFNHSFEVDFFLKDFIYLSERACVQGEGQKEREKENQSPR